ncbi:RNA-guided endonuclease IscB [Streptomyces sp. NPDC055400]
MVAVLDKHGHPLMPCHPARARKLLDTGRAVVGRHAPFVIRLKDRTVAGSEVVGVAIRIDPGSRGTGIAVTDDVGGIATDVTTSRRGLYSLELQHRGAQIRKSMQQRANHRRRRRTANLRYRTPRFDNRARPKGWLTPSLRHRVDSTVSTVTRLTRWFPVTELHVEQVTFDIHALSLGQETLENGQYQQGTLKGYETRQYLLEKWNRTCAYCGGTAIPLQIDHIRPRARGGTDRISNLTLACTSCNQAKAARPVEEFLARKPARLARVLSLASVPLKDAAAMNATRRQLWNRLCRLGLPMHAWSGGRTKYNRTTHGLAKSHTLDALSVGEIPEAGRLVRHPTTVLVAEATGRGCYARTRTDKYGFPRLYLPRRKEHRGFVTGDLVRATIPRGKYFGTHTGRVAVRGSGQFNIRTSQGLLQGIHHRYVSRLQRSDGYGYIVRNEKAKD